VSVLLPWIFLILFVAACGLGGWAFWVWWQRPRYTRERFAFVGLSSLIGAATLYLSSLLSEKSVLNLISHTLLQPFGIDVPTSPLSPLEAVLFSIIFFGLIYAYIEIFKHWDGQKSIAQHEQDQFRKSPNVLEDIALLFARDPEIRKTLQPYQENQETPSTVLAKPETIAWHQLAKELWALRHRSYHFENEYDPAHGWLGEEPHIGVVVLLACFFDSPPESKIQELVNYVQQVAKHRNQTQFEIILAIKQGTTGHEPQHEHLIYISEAELLGNHVNFASYFNEIRERVRAHLPGSDWTLQDMYTASRYRFHKEKEAKDEEIEQFIFRWLVENTPRQLAILGEYGQGKSTLSLWLCHRLIELGKTDATVRIPILIELRGKTLRTLQPEELLAIWAKNYSIDPRELWYLHRAGRLLLIFEGFDEIDLSGDTEARIAHFRTLWQFNHNHAKIIITGRPNFFLDSQELQRALGDTQQSHTLHLEPFNLQQIENSLRGVKAEIQRAIIALAEKDEKFCDVVARPSLLYIVALLWEVENLSERAHLNSADVIDLFIKHSLQRQQTKQDGRKKFMVLNSAERRYFMMGIAAYMAAKQLSNQIDKSQLEEAVNRLVDAIPDAVSSQVTEASGEDSRPLRSEQRLEWSIKRKAIMEKIHTDVRSCGLLVTDVSKEGAFKFAHKSYIELLQAQAIYQSSFASKEVEQQAGQSLSNRLGLGSGILQKSSEVFSFFTECLASHFQQQGIKDETSISKHLWRVLVSGRLSRPTLLSWLIEFWVSVAMGLVNQVSRFGIEPQHIHIILLSFFPVYLAVAVVVVGGVVGNVVVGGVVGNVVVVGVVVGVVGNVVGGVAAEAAAAVEERLHLWYRACKSLNLSQESIEKVAGKGMARLLAEREENNKRI
jgi:NACHT domain